jgi:xylan 1,4-beta-xylosidase
VLIWHYHDDDLPGADAAVDLALTGLPFPNGGAKLTQFRIDGEHGNSYGAWLKMGSPFPLSENQFAALEKAGQLAELESKNISVKNGAAGLQFNLPRQGVSLFVLEWP